MSWKTNLIKAIAYFYAPAKIVSMGVDTIKKEVKGEAERYKTQIKVFILLSLTILLSVVFASLSLIMYLNYYFSSPFVGYTIVAILYFFLTLFLAYMYRRDIWQSID